MPLYSLDGHAPTLPTNGRYWIAPGAQVIGKVTLKEDASIWFNCVLRGDNETLDIGEGTNVQDNCTLHSDPGFPLTLGKGVTIGHNAIVHGCTVGDHALIGMGATVLNGAKIGAYSVVVRECIGHRGQGISGLCPDCRRTGQGGADHDAGTGRGPCRDCRQICQQSPALPEGPQAYQRVTRRAGAYLPALKAS